MNIPRIPSNKNKYFDLGPTRQFDVEVICKALLQYEDTMKAKVEAAESDRDERFLRASERLAARELAARFSKKLPYYE